MVRIVRPRLAAAVTVPVLAAIFTVGTAGIASASDVTVGVPGTPVTAPCAITVHESLGLNQTPTLSESGTCNL